MFERVNTQIFSPAFGQFIYHIAIISRYVTAKFYWTIQSEFTKEEDELYNYHKHRNKISTVPKAN